MTVREKEELIAGLASKLRERGLAEPALLLLESHRPLSFLASQFLIFSSPFLGPGITRYASLLEDRSSLERLILELRRPPQEQE